jgi:hypothetical protein
MSNLSLDEKQEIKFLTERLMSGALAAMEFEAGVSQEDLDEMIAMPAEPCHWSDIALAFEGFRVPFDPHLREVYRTTLGVKDPQSYIAALCLPFLSANVKTPYGGWECCDLEDVMDTEHLWPLDNILDGDEDAFPMVIVGHGILRGLSVSENGKWSTLCYDGEGGREPCREDFTLTLLEALRLFVEGKLIEWASRIADEANDDFTFQLTMPSDDNIDARVLSIYDRLCAPRDLTAVKKLEVMTFAPKLIAAAAPGVMPFDQDGHSEAAEPLSPTNPDIISVVGLPFADYALVQDEMKEGQEVQLKPVEDNPHDPNAVEVWYSSEAGESFRIGFIPRDDVLTVRNLLAGSITSKVAHIAQCGSGYVDIRLI